MPAARAALAPEFRLFYDTLGDHGDWVLIEPYGYLFRPRVEYHTWRPYESGFWAPTDNFGWVWISSEPFGWATYHYGRWFYDDFRGWVWQPGTQWGPAWVDWQANDRYVGWTPLGPGNTWRPVRADVPGGKYVYAAVEDMGTADLELLRPSQLGAAVSDATTANNPAIVEGVEVPLGPSIQRIERVTGKSLARVKMADLLTPPQAEADAGRPEAAAGRSGSPERPVTIEDTRRAGEQAAKEARTLKGRAGGLPQRLPIVRPVGRPIEPSRPAKPDSVPVKSGG